MQTSEVLAQLQPWRSRHQRPAWLPQVIDGDGPVTASKFAGAPALVPGEPWPTCGWCRRPLTFFLQLNLGHVPAALEQCFGTGLLQLFYCLACADNWRASPDNQLVRVVPVSTLLGIQRPLPLIPSGTDIVPPARVGPANAEHFPPKTIVGWEQIIDFPHPPDHRDLDLSYTYDHAAGTARLDCPELGLSIDEIRDPYLAETIGSAAPGDKLAGWPRWVQDIAYLACPECGERMRLVFQLDSNDNLPFMFGDLGIGHITQCPTHLRTVTFHWDCH